MIALALFAAAAPKAVPMSLHLADGASWTIAADHSRKIEQAGKVNGWSLHTEKRVTFHRRRDGGPDELTVTPVSAEAGESSPPELAKARSFPVEATVQVDQQLTPVGLSDPKAVRRVFADLVQRDLKGSESLADASALVMIGGELGVASRGQAMPLVPGKPSVYDAVLAGPLAGLQIKAKASYVLESYEPEAGRATVVWRETVDPDSFRASVGAFMAIAAKADPATREKAAAALAGMSMTRSDVCRYQIDLGSGLAEKTDCTIASTITNGGEVAKTTETWSISQTVPESR